MSQSSQSYSPCPTCYRPRCQRCAHRHPPHSGRAHRVVFILSCSSRRAQRVVSYLPTFLCFRAKCGSSIYTCTLDIMNRTGLSHYAWNPLRVCECNKSICCDVPCLDSERDRSAMTRVVQTPFALTRLRPEGKCPDTAGCHESRAAGSSAPLPVPPSPLPPCGLPSSALQQPRSSSPLRRLDRSPPYRAGSDISSTYRLPASLGPFSLSPLYCLHVLLLSDVCVSLWLSLRVLLLSYVCVSLWLSLRVLLLFPHCSCLRVLSPVAASRVLAARRPSAIMCFPWARRLSHDVVWRNCVSLAGKL